MMIECFCIKKRKNMVRGLAMVYQCTNLFHYHVTKLQQDRPFCNKVEKNIVAQPLKKHKITKTTQRYSKISKFTLLSGLYDCPLHWLVVGEDERGE
jgi:hypothetical protein